jgi:hypothetical protein
MNMYRNVSQHELIATANEMAALCDRMTAAKEVSNGLDDFITDLPRNSVDIAIALIRFVMLCRLLTCVHRVFAGASRLRLTNACQQRASSSQSEDPLQLGHDVSGQCKKRLRPACVCV